MSHGRNIAVIGLGCAGLPVAVAFARSGAAVIGFDMAVERIAELRGGLDRRRAVDAADLKHPALRLTCDQAELSAADFFIVVVPARIDATQSPDLRMLLAASQTVGRALKPGDIVVYESTVPPGTTEADCAPVLEQASGLAAGRDFGVAYSPERINPGDAEHRFETIVKVVAAQDVRTLDVVAQVYGSVVRAGIHRAPSIRVAEVAKVLENIQRDLNVALMNELSGICHAIGVETHDVLAAARTKWNFLPFTPGLVGGHCLSADPLHLHHGAKRAGYHSEIALAGRRINFGIAGRVARECARRLAANGGDKVTILGLTFKENIPDVRNSQVGALVRELRALGLAVQLLDPLALPDEAMREHGIELASEADLEPADAVILAVPHAAYMAGSWALVAGLLKNGSGLVMDLKAALDRAAKPPGVELWRL